MVVYYSEIYKKWFGKLRDKMVKLSISRRIEKIEKDNHIGDAAYIGDYVYEFRIHHGPGYRVYFQKQNDKIIILLCGGDKSSQDSDILLAKKLAKEV